MKRFKRIAVSIALSAAMVAGLSACDEVTEQTAVQPEPEQVTVPVSPEDTLVYGTGELTGNFNPFYATAKGDRELLDVTGVKLLYTDRAGNWLLNASHTQTTAYGDAEYSYTAPADVDIAVNENGEAEYTFRLRDDLSFSDGTPLTADDVIFTMYVLCDPSYDGPWRFSELPIKGLKEYKNASVPLYELIIENGADNEDFTYYSQEDQKAFYEDLPRCGEEFAKSICRAAVDKYGYFVIENDVVSAMYLWGFANVNEDGSITGTGSELTWTLQGDDKPDYFDFWTEMCIEYGCDYVEISKSESAGQTLFSFLDDRFNVAVATGEEAVSIRGIERVDDYTVRVTLTEGDADVLSKMSFYIAPLHCYGDTTAWNPLDETTPTFGFEKGRLAEIRAITTPVGAGAYVLESFEDVTAHLVASGCYYEGAAECEKLDLVAMQGGNEVASVMAGYPDIATTTVKDLLFNDALSSASDGIINDEVLTAAYYNTGTYGYIGINADRVKADKYAGSSKSMALRRAFAEIFAACAENAVADDFYEGANVVIPSGYEAEDVLTDARTLLESAGFKFSDGKVQKASENGKLSYEILVPAGHPAEKVAASAAAMFESLGLELTVTSVDDAGRIWGLVKAGNADMFAGAWNGESNADLYEKYGTDGAYSYLYDVKMEEIDSLMEEAAKAADPEEQSELYVSVRQRLHDFAVEVPIYARYDTYILSSQRVDVSTVPGDLTAYYPLLRAVAKIKVQ